MGVKILSLFDGMACGMIAMQLAGVQVESYDAYEIDKYAIKTAQHNFPMIKEHGDVFDADFTQYEDVDFGIGGSPCTHWSIAQTKNRETTVNRDSKGNILLHQSGIGVELFSQFLRMLSEAKPKFFIYENNKSMSKEIRTAITECFGFEPTEINSALVSAQNRQRLYWVGRRNEYGTYSKVNVEQPADRGILLRDILETGVVWQEKSYNLTTRCCGGIPEDTLKRHRHTMVAEPVRGMENDTKSRTLTANYWKTNVRDAFVDCAGGRTMAAEPVCLRYERTEEAKRCRKAYEAHEIKHGYNELNELHPRPDGKTNTLTTVLKDNQIAEPLQYEELSDEYYKGCADGNLVGMIENEGKYKNGKQPSQQYRVYSCEDKSVCVDADQRKHYIIPYSTEFDDDGRPIKAIGKDGKEITIYEVKDGKITIKGKQYPIKLKDGYYIIRKLTVRECKRLQTVPEWYEFPVSNSQAYKMLGNGWTCEVIAHLIRSCMAEQWGSVDG